MIWKLGHIAVWIFALAGISGARVEANNVVFAKGYSRCYSNYVDWKSQAHHAATFAVSPSTAAGQNCGSSSGLGSEAKAGVSAIAECRRNRNHQLASDCFVYDIR